MKGFEPLKEGLAITIRLTEYCQVFKIFTSVNQMKTGDSLN
ncbi:protein of unknown function [Candidatus Promineifilum breve]|uniref:Uncharacterized protein n=1 Tax=Candidatus Promineifilum breve TaxID=1806508 RepID=A0A170PFA7_9CHLR|nr:protein of unknown function [Candidatus Promineifilum breve]